MREELTGNSDLQKNGPEKRPGFTLIEVVIAASLLAIAMVPILKALTIAYVTSSAIEQKTRSLMLAESRLDEIRIRAIYNYDSSFAQTNLSLGSSYLCNVVDTAVSSNLRTVTIQVGYDLDANGQLSANETGATLSTLIARRK